MNAGNNLSQPQPLKSQISIQRGQDQKTNPGAGIPGVEQHQPHCCLNPQSNYGFYFPQGQGPPQNAALIQQQHVNQANPNVCGYCHCQCHFQHPTVQSAYPICYQQTSPQGTSRSFVSTSPSPYHMVAAASNPGMPFTPLMQTPACIPTFTTSYTYPAAAGANNQQPNTSAYHMYVSTTAINMDDPRAAGLKAIKSTHEETSDSHGATSDSSTERITTRPEWKWESVPASSDKQRSEGKIPRDEYKNQNVRQTTSTSSKKYVGGNNTGSLSKKDNGFSNKKNEVAKAKDINVSSLKVNNSYARDGNSYIREGDSYARPTTYTVRDDQASLRSGGRRVSISSNPPTKESFYSGPLNVKDETTDRTEDNRLSERKSSKTGSARRSGVQKIKNAVRRSNSKVQPANKSSNSIGKQIEHREDKEIVKAEESYVEDVEEVLATDTSPLEQVEEVANEYFGGDYGTSSYNVEYYEDPTMPEKKEIQENRDVLNNIGDQNVGINEVDTHPEKVRDNDNENKSQAKSLEANPRRNATSLSDKRSFGSYELSKAKNKELGINQINGLLEKGNGSENKSQPKSLKANSGRDTNRFNDEHGRVSYEMPKANLNKEPAIIEINGIPEKGRDNHSEKKSQPKSLGLNTIKNATSLSDERDRVGYQLPNTTLNKGPTVSQKNIQPIRVVSDVERAAATQTSGIPLPTKAIPVEFPKTGATWKPNVTRRSVDQQSQTGKFPRKKTLEMLSKLSLESFDKLISSFVGISLYDKDERIADLINAILESAEPEMEGSTTLRNTLYIPPEVFADDENISRAGENSKYRLPGAGGYQYQQRKNEETTLLQKPGYLKNLSPQPKNITGPISASARKASVNNIIQEFSNNKKFDDTLSNIKEKFPGEKIDDFVKNLSQHAEKMTDDKEIENSGRLVRLLIGNRDISKKEAINVISSALVDLPQNLIDSPMAATSTAQYLVEIFSEESNFDWLFQIGTKLIQTDDVRTSAAWRDLSINTLKMLQSKNNENSK